MGNTKPYTYKGYITKEEELFYDIYDDLVGHVRLNKTHLISMAEIVKGDAQ